MFNVSNLLFTVLLWTISLLKANGSFVGLENGCGGVKAYGLTGVRGGSATVCWGSAVACGLWPVGVQGYDRVEHSLLVLGSSSLGVLGLGHWELCWLGPI